MHDRKFRGPRVWSNRELSKIAPLVQGSVVNVSAWQDKDKEGRRYADYFSNASDYWVTNFRTDARGYQGTLANEIFLDLEKPLPAELHQRFDAVLNHTVLEHVYDVKTAFANLCQMSRGMVIVVVPFLQEQHGAYGDFWRFTPQAVARMFKDNGFELRFLSHNDSPKESVYLFAVGTTGPGPWTNLLAGVPGNMLDGIDETMLGCGVISNGLLYRVSSWLARRSRRGGRPDEP